MVENFYPHGKLCICSVQKKEEGFEDYRYVAYLAATSLGFDVIRNPERNGITQEEFEYYLTHEYPVFILIVGTIESEIVNREVNLALEKCLPILVFIKTKNNVISEESQKIIKKYSEVSYNYECTTFSTCEILYKQVEARLKSYILDKRMKHPILQKGVPLAYRANTELMKKSKRQIIIYQRTSILLLGPRRGCIYESEFYRTLTEWLMKKQNENIKFVHVFNWEETMQEKNEHADEYSLSEAKNNLSKLYKQYQSTNEDCLNIRYSHVYNSVPYVITDTNLVFIIPIENERFSMELPAHIMKESEICTILDEITRKTTIITPDRIEEFYK